MNWLRPRVIIDPAAAAVMIVMLAVAGCGSPSDDVDSSATSTSTTTSAENAAHYPVTISHKQGETVLDKRPQRIVVLDYAALDYVDSMGFGSAIVGIPAGKIVPPSAENYGGTDEVGPLGKPDLKRIAELKPDLILTSSGTAVTYEKLAAVAPTVELADAGTDVLGNNAANARQMGRIFGVDADVEAELAALDEKVVTVREQVAALGATALVVVNSKGKTTAYGVPSRLSLVYDLGFIGIDGLHGGEPVKYSAEDIAKADPEFLFVINRDTLIDTHDQSATSTAAEEKEDTLGSEVVRKSRAAQHRHIVYLNAAEWYQTGIGLTTLNTMVDAVGDAIKQ